MTTQNSPSEAPVRRVDRIIAFTALTLAVLSVVCFFALFTGSALGLDEHDFGQGAWPFIAVIPLYGLPLAFLLIIVLLVMTFIRKGRAAKRP